LCAIPHLGYDYVLMTLPMAYFWDRGINQGQSSALAAFWVLTTAYWFQFPETLWKLAGRPESIWWVVCSVWNQRLLLGATLLLLCVYALKTRRSHEVEVGCLNESSSGVRTKL